MGIEHHALPDGFGQMLEDMADEVAMLVPDLADPNAFTDRKREIQRKLWALSDFGTHLNKRNE